MYIYNTTRMTIMALWNFLFLLHFCWLLLANRSAHIISQATTENLLNEWIIRVEWEFYHSCKRYKCKHVCWDMVPRLMKQAGHVLSICVFKPTYYLHIIQNILFDLRVITLYIWFNVCFCRCFRVYFFFLCYALSLGSPYYVTQFYCYIWLRWTDTYMCAHKKQNH